MGPFESKGSDSWDCRIGEHLVCLADCTSGDIFPNISGEAWPPVILGEEGNGVEVTTMAAFKGTVGSRNKMMAGNVRYIGAGLEVEMSIIEDPIFGFQSVKEGEFLFHPVDSLENQWVNEGQVFDFVH